MRSPVLAAAALLALTFASACDRSPRRPAPKDADAVAALTGRATLGGTPIDAATLRDKIIVINFWSPG